MTLAGGAIFGLVEGTILVSFASTIGATLAFLASRVLLRDAIQKNLGIHLKPLMPASKKKGQFTCSDCAWFHSFRFL